MNTEAIFQERQQQFIQDEQATQRQYNQLAIWRFVWFLAIIAFIWFFNEANQTIAAIAAFLVGLVVFGWMLKRHQAIRRKRDLSHHLAFINDDEAKRLHRQYLRPETGESFLSLTHAYAGDLDIFRKTLPLPAPESDPYPRRCPPARQLATNTGSAPAYVCASAGCSRTPTATRLASTSRSPRLFE